MISSAQHIAPSSRDIMAAAGLVGIAFMGSTLVTPLYRDYQSAFGFTEFTLTLVYASYVLGNLASLMLFGRLSDVIGRKPVALASLAFAVIATTLYLAATDVGWLFAARFTSGVAVALGSGAGTAWLVDLYGRDRQERASLYATTANFGASAVGPLVSGTISHYQAESAALSWSLYLLALAVVIGVVSSAHETVERSPRITATTFVPIVGVPRGLRTTVIGPLIAAFCTFAMLGYYLSVMPGILAVILQRTEPILSGLVVFEVFIVAMVMMIVFRRTTPRRATLIGLALSVPGLACFLLAQLATSVVVLVLATAAIGVSAGMAFLGSLGQVNAISPDDQRGQMASTYYIACFVGASVPIVAVGALTTVSGPVAGSIGFVVLLILMSTVGVALELRPNSD